MKKLVQEFKEFIMRGNVIDMAVGVVIGAAFKGIIDSLVNDILNPIIGFLLSGVNFSAMAIVLKAAEGDKPAVAINYGSLINHIISFLLTAIVLFLIIKAYNHLRRKSEEPAPEPEAPAAPTETELLTQILEELKSKK